jgi:hypothetical protein
VYIRPALALDAIERKHGRAKLEAALSRYARTQRFRHPAPRDLFAAFDATYGAGFSSRELEPLLDGKRDAVLAPAAAAQAPAARPGLFTRLLFAAQALLHWIAA